MQARGSGLTRTARFHQLAVKRYALCWVLVAAVMAVPAAEAAQITVYLERESLTLPSVTIQGVEYLSLGNLARALGDPLQRSPTRGRYRIALPGSSVAVAVGSPEVRVGKAPVSLSLPVRRLGRDVVVPLELLPIALAARYGEGRVDWDPERHVARIAAKAYSLRLVRFRTYPDHTRVVVEGTRPHDFVLKDDGGSGRVVLEVRRGILSPSIRSGQVDDGLVASIEPRQLGPDSQITINGARRQLRGKAFALQRPDRIVVDLFPRPSRPSDLSPSEEIVKTVVIDPGHGGRDSGAIGPSGVKEKDIVLDVSLRLKRLIERDLGMNVIMTRSEDVFVPLESRTAIANRHRADFFISVHVNAAPGSQAVGLETYFLSREPSDRGARASAVRENTALNLEGLGQDAQRGLKAILWDLAQTFYVAESSELAELLLNELGQRLNIDNRGVKSAPFFVLIGAAMPSVLVEVAFITNPQEEQKLEQEAYRQQVAEALLTGIAKFKARYEKRVGSTPARGAS